MPGPAAPPPDDPLAPARGLDLDGLLRLLGTRLDGAAEAEVARGALGAGVPYATVLAEVQREVERRLTRALGAAAFYGD